MTNSQRKATGLRFKNSDSLVRKGLHNQCGDAQMEIGINFLFKIVWRFRACVKTSLDHGTVIRANRGRPPAGERQEQK